MRFEVEIFLKVVSLIFYDSHRFLRQNKVNDTSTNNCPHKSGEILQIDFEKHLNTFGREILV